MFIQKLFKKRLAQIRKSYTRSITVYPDEVETTCPDCNYDSVNRRSAEPNCSTCSGRGVIVTVGDAVIIKAKVKWVNPQSAYLPSLGKVSEGKVTFYCDYSYLAVIKASSKIVIDGITVQVYEDNNGKLAVKPVENISGDLDRLKVTCEVKPIQ